MNKKAFFLDLDDTLFTSEKKISPAIRRALQDRISTGNEIIFCTGRPTFVVKKIKAGLDLPDQHCWIAGFNGSQLYDCTTQTVIWQCSIDHEDAGRILELGEKYHIHTQLYNDTGAVGLHDTPEGNYYGSRYAMPYYHSSQPFSLLNAPTPKILIISFERHDLLNQIEEEIHALFGAKYTTVHSTPNFLEVFSKDGGKGNAVRRFCDLLRIPIEDSIAAGDEENDISMLEAAGLGIAMQNASPRVKSYADVVTEKDNNHDGLLPYLTLPEATPPHNL